MPALRTSLSLRPFCKRPGDCQAKGKGHCRRCMGAHFFAEYVKKLKKRGALGSQARRAARLKVSLAPVKGVNP
jgi:hypothetical protein